MAALSKSELLAIVEQAISASGWNLIHISDEHPFRLHIYDGEDSYRIRIYIWNITSGGRNRPANEYRIQITGFDHFDAEIGGKTLILGWWAEAGVFAGFDFARHSGRLGSSPSFQIREAYLRAAYEHGFSPCLKDNQEIALAFRPEMFVEYIQNLEVLHGFGDSPADLAVLDAVSVDPYTANVGDFRNISETRRVVVSSVQRRLRSSTFRAKVLAVYNQQCAFCGLQLGLVQAAHVLPVSHEESTDDTHNGVAACYLHHAAYDKSLITFDQYYKTHVNDAQMRDFQETNRYGQADRFVRDIRPLIILPPAITDRPHARLVEAANQVRGWIL